MQVEVDKPWLMLGDCLEMMQEIPDGSVDLIITSPPYDAGKAYEGRRDLDLYMRFASAWTSSVIPKLTKTGSFWLNVGYTKLGKNETLPLTYLYYQLIQLPMVQEVVWHYEGGMAYKNRFSHRTERWMWFSKAPAYCHFDLDAVRDSSLNRTVDKRNHPGGKNPTDYWYFDRVVGGCGASAEKTIHPCQFPLKMVERIINACCPQNGTVLDPFMGSGTTGVACANTGRRFIGIEKDPAYFETATLRIHNHIRQKREAAPDLFAAAD